MMDLKMIKELAARLGELAGGWNRGIDEVERDIALALLRDLYAAIKFYDGRDQHAAGDAAGERACATVSGAIAQTRHDADATAEAAIAEVAAEMNRAAGTVNAAGTNAAAETGNAAGMNGAAGTDNTPAAKTDEAARQPEKRPVQRRVDADVIRSLYGDLPVIPQAPAQPEQVVETVEQPEPLHETGECSEEYSEEAAPSQATEKSTEGERVTENGSEGESAQETAAAILTAETAAADESAPAGWSPEATQTEDSADATAAGESIVDIEPGGEPQPEMDVPQPQRPEEPEQQQTQQPQQPQRELLQQQQHSEPGTGIPMRETATTLREPETAAARREDSTAARQAEQPKTTLGDVMNGRQTLGETLRNSGGQDMASKIAAADRKSVV